MANIRVLDDLLANKIAAGEVVEKCASVVKELVENSIDAGSDEIKIDLIDAGTKLIRVTDNGKGMDKSDDTICFLRHATSKLKTEEDLYQHIDYIHYNSVKHYGIAPKDWMFASFNKFVKSGVYEQDWCNFDDKYNIKNLSLE